jgi:uncharacterized protein
MLGNFYPFWAAFFANLIAQGIKPFVRYFTHRSWQFRLITDSGGFPSSHTSTVTALILSVGLQEGFGSSIFTIALVFGMITAYDAANVRYYAGRNIQITQQLIRDLKSLTTVPLDDPIYVTKVKEVLGHHWFEVFGGIMVGLLVAGVLYYMR